MQSYDLFMLAIIVAAVAWGAWKGFAWQLASLASIILSYFVAFNFRNPMSAMFGADPQGNIFSSMLLLFMGTSGGVWASYHFVSDLIAKVRLREFDRQVGALFGLVKGVLLCVIITLFSVTLLGEQSRQAIVNSRSGYYIANLLVQSEAFMPPEIQHVLAPYLYDLGPQQAGYPVYTNAPANGWQQGYEQQPQPGYGQPTYQQGYNPQDQYQPYQQNPQYPQNVPYDPRMTNQPGNGGYYQPPVNDWRR